MSALLTSLQAVYSGKKVFVTGHTGFKGSWLLALLHVLGAKVMGYALPPEQPLFAQLQGETLCDSVLGDIRDPHKLTRAIQEFEPQFLFHLAAQPIVRKSYAEPVDTFAINAMGTLEVLEALRQFAKPCAAVFITTDKVYENREWLYPYRETDALGGYDPYSASKACAELIVQSYRSSFFNPKAYSSHHKAIATARAGNVIGGGDWADDRILPDMARAAQAYTTLAVRNPQAVRPWQHVLEPLAGYLQLGAHLQQQPEPYAGAYNFGPRAEDTLPVGELVALAQGAWGKDVKLEMGKGEGPHEAGLLRLDSTKAITTLGWRQRLSAAEAVKLTVNWYKDAGHEPLAYTLGQIKGYLALD